MLLRSLSRFDFYSTLRPTKWTNNRISSVSLIKQKNQRRYSEGSTAEIHECGNRLEVKVPRWPHSLNLSNIWLRDHCRCSDCYSSNTFQRVKDVHDIPLNIRPVSVSSNEKELQVVWPDGHTSIFDFKFLWENSYEGKKLSKNFVEPITWSKYSFPKFDEIQVPYEQLKGNEKGQKRLVETLLKHGVGLVTGVAPTVEATREVVEELCQVRRTFFGEMWAFQSDLEHADSAYSSEYLGAHTDTTYFTEASRIQVFHCLKVANEGGETLLVDGFHLGEQLRKQNPTSYEFLSNTVFPSEYIGDDQHHLSQDVIFKHHPISKKLMQFRYNIYDRAPLSSLPFNMIEEYYSHLHKLTSLVREPSNEVEFLLQPGQVLLIDNWRVMHGRNAYEGTRIMGGCYLENGDFTSKARTLGLMPH